jgi:hypothetical protein
MPNNRIDAVLSPEDVNAILDAIDTIRARMPFLVGLAPAERKGLPKMGDKGRAFVSKALEIASRSSRLLPSELLEQFKRDVELSNALQPVMLAWLQLGELISDSYLLAGSEAYTGALAVYEMAKRSGYAEALDALTAELGRRFVRTPVRAEPSEPAS